MRLIAVLALFAGACGEQHLPTSLSDAEATERRKPLECEVVGDGAPCGFSSPWQKQGICGSGTCDRAAPAVLDPAWRLGGWAVASRPDGRIYSVENDYPAARALVAHTLDGREVLRNGD